MKRALIAALCLGVAVPARADIGVVVTGEATLQPLLAAQLEGWLAKRGHVVHPSSLEPDAINTLIDCFVIGDLGCARAVVDKRARAQTILFARVEMKANKSDGSRDIAISGYWITKDHETLQERRTCRHCTEKRMRDAADDLMLALTAEPPSQPVTPEAAAAPTAVVSTPTYATAAPVGSVRVAQAEPASPSAAASQPADEPAHSSKLLPIAITAAGGVALVGGVGMIALGGPPADKTQRLYWNYRTPGYAVAGAGVVALGVGLYLLLRPDAQSAPVAAVSAGGAVFGWTGRF